MNKSVCNLHLDFTLCMGMAETFGGEAQVVPGRSRSSRFEASRRGLFQIKGAPPPLSDREYFDKKKARGSPVAMALRGGGGREGGGRYCTSTL